MKNKETIDQIAEKWAKLLRNEKSLEGIKQALILVEDKGILTVEELRQLMYNGIPIVDSLKIKLSADSTTVFHLIEEKSISYNLFIEALEDKFKVLSQK